LFSFAFYDFAPLREMLLLIQGLFHSFFLRMCAIRFPAFGMLTRDELQYLTAKGATVMSKNEAQVLEKALALPPDERAELADRLLSSLDTERQRKIDELWVEEAEDRIDASERGEIRALSAKEAFETNKGAKA
jgi:putative addiction module component (TIGR02574 family)